MLVKLSKLVNTPAVVILNTVPKPPVPPTLVVPYKLPSLACTSAASGADPRVAPVVPVKLAKLVNVPLVVILKIVPKPPPLPPVEVRP